MKGSPWVGTVSAGLSRSLRNWDLSDPFLSASCSPSEAAAMGLPDPERLQTVESAPVHTTGLGEVALGAK